MKCLLEVCIMSFVFVFYLGVVTLVDSMFSFSVYEKRVEVFVIIKVLDCFLGVLNFLIVL